MIEVWLSWYCVGNLKDSYWRMEIVPTTRRECNEYSLKKQTRSMPIVVLRMSKLITVCTYGCLIVTSSNLTYLTILCLHSVFIHGTENETTYLRENW